MAKRVVLAVSHREYAAKLAEYLRDEESGWDIGVFTHGSALRKELQDKVMVDLLIGQTELLLEANTLCERAGKVMSLVKQKGMDGGRWQEIVQYQPLPSILSAIRSGMVANQSGSTSGCQVVTVFSASGGVGKTTVALNLIRQAGERGLRTFYMNLETLNATSLLFGKGEPDSLSRLLYALQTHPEQWDSLLEQLCRHQPQLRTDYVDAPDHPGERLALTPELTEVLLEKFRSMGRYDLIVIDPDSGAGEWHRKLLDLSDRVIWLVADDAQGLMKSEKLLRHWQAHIGDKISKLSIVLNKAIGDGLINRWNLPGEAPKAVLPYIPQWKAIDQPGRLLASPAFSGAVEQLLLSLEIGGNSISARRRREEVHGNQRSHVRGAG